MDFSESSILTEEDFGDKSYHLLSERLKEKRRDSIGSQTSTGSQSSDPSLVRKTAIRPPPRPGMERLMARHHRAGSQSVDDSDPVVVMSRKMDEDRQKMEEEFAKTLSEAHNSLVKMHRLADLRGENYRTNWVLEALRSDDKEEGDDWNRYDKAYVQTNMRRVEEFEAAAAFERDSEFLPDRPKNTFKESKVKCLREKLNDMNRKAQTCLDHLQSARKELDDMSSMSNRLDVDDDDPSILKMKVLLNDDYLKPEVMELLKSLQEQPAAAADAEDDYESDEDDDDESTETGTDNPAFLTDRQVSSQELVPVHNQVPPMKTIMPK